MICFGALTNNPYLLLFFIPLIFISILNSINQSKIEGGSTKNNKPVFGVPNLKQEEIVLDTGHLKIKFADVLSGEYKDYKIKIITNDYGKYMKEDIPHMTVTEIDMGDIELPYIYLKSKKSVSVLNYKRFTNNEKEVRIKLGGDLGKNFKLLCTQDYEIEVLEIFTEDFLHFLMAHANNFSIEFVGNKIYFYNAKEIKTKEEIQEVYNMIEKLLYKIEPLMKRLTNDIEAMNNSYRR